MATGDVIRLGGGQAAFPVRQRRALEPLLAAAPPYPMGWPHSWKFMREQFIKEKKCPCVNIAVGAAFPFQPTHPPESVRRFPSNHGRCYLADRAYAKGSHRAYTLKRGAGFTFRLPPSLVKQFTPPQRDQQMDRPCWPRNPSASTAISDTGARSMGYGWVGTLLPQEKRDLAVQRSRQKSGKRQNQSRPSTPEYARWIAPATALSDAGLSICKTYRRPWQTERLFGSSQTLLNLLCRLLLSSQLRLPRPP